MTVQEFKNEFNIHYNSIATQSAPSIDDYELSVFLTKAQLEIVKNYYTKEGNKYKKGFENTEKRRVDLKELIKTFTSNLIINSNINLSQNSKFFKIPDDVFLIVYESANIELNNCGIVSTYVDPITHDDYNIQNSNPFKKPNKNKTWRLSVSKINNDNVVELINPFKIVNYTLRYIKYPKPIIISNLDNTFPGENLKIDNISTLSECELNQSIHREILDRAVEIALRDYKPSNLESKIQLDTRNE